MLPLGHSDTPAPLTPHPSRSPRLAPAFKAMPGRRSTFHGFSQCWARGKREQHWAVLSLERREVLAQEVP